MSNLDNRITKLEQKHAPPDAKRTVVVYADDHTPAELEAMQSDESIGTLIIIEYQDAQPLTAISWQGNPHPRYIGIDAGKL